VRRIQEGIYQIVSPFPQFQRSEVYTLRDDLEARPRVLRTLPYILPYFITSRGDNLLVDCGWDTDDSRLALQEQLAELGSGVADIQNLVITHAHPDHCGLAGRLKQESNCTVWMHEAEEAFLRSRYVEVGETLGTMDKWLVRMGLPPEDRDDLERGSMPMRFFVATVEPDKLLQGGEKIEIGDFTFEVVWTPGHSKGHICLYEPNHELLLSGDHVLPTITPNVSLHPQQDPNPLASYLDSLDRVSRLKVKRMLPAHEWDITDFQRRVEKIVVHHEERLEEMLAAIGSHQAVTVATVAERISWNTGPYESLDAWMKRSAVGETMSHLVYLLEQGRVTQSEVDGVLMFQAA